MITPEDMQVLWLFAALSVVAIWAFAIWSFFKMIELEKRFQVRYDVTERDGVPQIKPTPAQELMTMLKTPECLDAMDAKVRETEKRKP